MLPKNGTISKLLISTKLMYDRLKLFYPRMSDTPDISQYLSNATEQTNMTTGEVTAFGYIDRLKVCLYVGGYSINGSLSRYFFGDSNINPLGRKTTAQAVEKLSDALHLDIKQSSVTALEFGTQMPMLKPTNKYLDKLGSKQRMQRYRFEADTLYYKPKGRQQPKILCMYDKLADAQKKGMSLPIGFDGLNLLRYELRLNGRLAHQIGVPMVQASTLYETNFYCKLIKMWQDEYFNIEKMKQIKTTAVNDVKTVKDAFDVLVARLINQSEPEQITAFMDELKTAKVFDDRKYYTRLKNKIIEVANKTKLTVTDSDIKELDDAIKNVGAYI